MNVDARVEAWVSLQISGIAPRPLAELLGAFGSAQAVLAASPAQRRAFVTGPAGKAMGAAPDRERLARTLAWLAEPEASLVAWDDSDYPRPLLEIGQLRLRQRSARGDRGADPRRWTGNLEWHGRPAHWLSGHRPATHFRRHCGPVEWGILQSPDILGLNQL